MPKSKVDNSDTNKHFKLLKGRDESMEGFKILKNPNEPTTHHMRAKCRKNNSEFLIRLEKEKGAWYMVLATRIEGSGVGLPAVSSSELKFDNGLFAGDSYSCPFCGDKDIVQCGACNKITCVDGGNYFVCAYCGNSGEINGKIIAANTEQPGQKAKK